MDVIQPNPWMILPFGVLLGLIALGPLFFANWWMKHYAKVAFALGAVTLGYYLFGFQGAESKQAHHTILETAHEYISFIALIGSLYVVSGGIHINVKGEATPFGNVVFLLIGAVLANILGTTGASMLLIRPWLRMNKYRVTAHHVVFFIFIVSNVGGCLTPIGDPPLFLGYIEGIPFWWVTEHCWMIWATAIAILLAMFYVVDTMNFRRAPKKIREQLTHQEEQWRFDGLWNIVFLAIILGAVFVNHPLFLREAMMLGAAIGSYYTTKKAVHHSNDFNFHPIQEVAILFIGIFATMMPALGWLASNSHVLGNPSPSFYYWATGGLSGVLDNAPTYLSFLSAISGSIDPDVLKKVQHLIQTHGTDINAVVGPHADQVRQTFAALQKYQATKLAAGTLTPKEIEIAFLLGNTSYNAFIVAISIGAVFFGANTYIGNGPNFMVKAIAEHNKVSTPSFMGYILKFTIPVMLPMLFIIWWIFFR